MEDRIQENFTEAREINEANNPTARVQTRGIVKADINEDTTFNDPPITFKEILRFMPSMC